MSKITFAAIAVAVALPSFAFAQSAPVSSAAPAAAPAVTTPSATPAGGQVTGGLTSDPAAKARFEALRAACGVDLKTHCADVPRGSEQARSEMRQCIATHKASFSAACQAALAERDAAREARKTGATMPATSEKPKG